MAAISSTAASNACWFALDGDLMLVSLRTYWSAEARTSSSVAGDLLGEFRTS
jgi:hypothetical protein